MDWILDASGRRIAPQRLWLSEHLDNGLDLVHRYQVRQDGSGGITLLLEPRGTLDDRLLGTLRSSYRRMVGGLPVEVRLVSRLEAEPSGKFRTIVAESAGQPGRPDR
jgi:hypothetical protein